GASSSTFSTTSSISTPHWSTAAISPASSRPFPTRTALGKRSPSPSISKTSTSGNSLSANDHEPKYRPFARHQPPHPLCPPARDRHRPLGCLHRPGRQFPSLRLPLLPRSHGGPPVGRPDPRRLRSRHAPDLAPQIRH